MTGVEQFPQLPLKGETAGQIADLASLLRDLTFARQCAETYVGWLAPDAPKDEQRDLIRQALWNAGVISYRRVFGSGKAHVVPQGSRLRPTDEWKKYVTSEQLEAHEAVLEMADKHIAHRVGDHEQVQVIAFFQPPPLPRGVATVGTLMVHMSGPTQTIAEHLISLCTLLIQGTEQESDRLLQLAAETLNDKGAQEMDAMYAAASTLGPKT